MFAIIAALWSMYALYNAVANWDYVNHLVYFRSKSYFSAFTSWALISLFWWLIPIGLLKFFIYLFS